MGSPEPCQHPPRCSINHNIVMFLTKPDPEDVELEAGGGVDHHHRVEIKRKEADGVSPERGFYSSFKACVKAVVAFLFGSRQRSLLTLSFVWCLITGPWTGLLAAAAWEEHRYQFPCVATCLTF